MRIIFVLIALAIAYMAAQDYMVREGRLEPGVQATLSSAQPSTCDPQSFVVTGAKFRRQLEYIVVTATVTNRGQLACGVHLKFTTFNKSGEAVATTDFWPASLRNIQPGAAEPFTYQLLYEKSAVTYDLRSVDARVWR